MGKAEEALAALTDFERVVTETSQHAYRTFVHEWRGRFAAAFGDAFDATAELGTAQRLMAALGATGHAARLAREIAA